MAKIRMEKQSYDGYCVGRGLDHPGIVVWGKNDEELITRFKAAVPTYEAALKKYKTSVRPRKEVEVEVITIDRKDMDKQT